jgi:hypothetical protein
LEALKGSCKGQHSIRINDQWPICFRWESDGPHDIEIMDDPPAAGYLYRISRRKRASQFS